MAVRLKRMQGGVLKIYADETEVSCVRIEKGREEAGDFPGKTEEISVPLGTLKGRKNLTLRFMAEHGGSICEMYDFCIDNARPGAI